jgi:hypothetical protein
MLDTIGAPNKPPLGLRFRWTQPEKEMSEKQLSIDIVSDVV